MEQLSLTIRHKPLMNVFLNLPVWTKGCDGSTVNNQTWWNKFSYTVSYVLLIPIKAFTVINLCSELIVYLRLLQFQDLFCFMANA